jgi:Chaperone of endosialidase
MKLPIITLAFVWGAALASAQTSTVPSLLSYQGQVTDLNGTAVGNTNPVNRTVQFRLYSASAGGNALWAESQTVTISGGNFSVLIGNGAGISGSPGPSSPASTTISLTSLINSMAAEGLYLGISVADAAGALNEIAPRQRLVSGAYAARARMAETVAVGAVVSDMLGDGAITANKIAGGVITGAKITANTITGGNIQDNTIANIDIADGAITANKFASSVGVWVTNASETYNGGNVSVYNGSFAVHGNQSSNHIQGAFLEWNRPGAPSGATHLLNQKGPGTGGIIFGEIDGANTVKEYARFDNTTGNLGIGTTNPVKKLDVAGDIKSSGEITADRIKTSGAITSSGEITANSFYSPSGPVTANSVVANAITSNGDIHAGRGVHAKGATNYHERGTYLEWNRDNGDGASWILNQREGGVGGFRFGGVTGAAGSIMGGTDNRVTEWMTINGSTGNVAIGNALTGAGGNNTSVYPLSVNRVSWVNVGGYGYINKDGNTGRGNSFANYSMYCWGRAVAEEFNAPSDKRLKKNIVPITTERALQFIDTVTAMQYNWKTGETGDKFGFIAQDVAKAGFDNLLGLTPDATMAEEVDDSGFLSPKGSRFALAYDQIIPLLTVAIKDLSTRLQKSEAQVATIQAELAEKNTQLAVLESRLAAIEARLNAVK